MSDHALQPLPAAAANRTTHKKRQLHTATTAATKSPIFLARKIARATVVAILVAVFVGLVNALSHSL